MSVPAEDGVSEKWRTWQGPPSSCLGEHKAT